MTQRSLKIDLNIGAPGAPSRGLTPQAIRAGNNILYYSMDLLDNKIHSNNKGEIIIRLKNIKYNLTPEETRALKEL